MDQPTTTPPSSNVHPGSGRRKAPRFPKGRVLDDKDLEEIRTMLGDTPRNRDLLIEFLHLIQDKKGFLPAGLLHALAEEMRIPMSEVYETASFYAHFDIVHDEQAPPPETTVRVCDSLSCMLKGSDTLISALEKSSPPNARIIRAPCMGRCDQAPVCEVGHFHVDNAAVDSVLSAIASDTHDPIIPDYENLEARLASKGYNILRSCIEGGRSREEVIAALSDGGLRGLGGAGFPTGRKWDLVRSEPGPRMMAVNADEGEPGTFKDRHYLEREPHAFLEGMLIAAWAVEAESVYIYLRDEYPAVYKILLKEISALRIAGLSDHTKVHLRRGAGAYICGEESAMIESIEGKRGLPRHRPPYVAQAGIFDRPTLVNNVETLIWVPKILEKGASWFASHGVRGSKGLRSYSVSGRVKNPGVKIAPAGTTARELLIDYCDGMSDGHAFKAYLPGGASGGILPESLADLPLDFGTLGEYGCFVGSHAVIFLSDQDDMKDVALNLMKFFEDESCGQCTPCRQGTEKATALMAEPKWDMETLNDLANVMADASICGLGQAAPNPLLSVMKYFPEDL